MGLCGCSTFIGVAYCVRMRVSLCVYVPMYVSAMKHIYEL